MSQGPRIKSTKMNTSEMPHWTIWVAVLGPTVVASIGMVWALVIAILWRRGFEYTTMAMGLATFTAYLLGIAGLVWLVWCLIVGAWGLALWIGLSLIAGILGMGLAGLATAIVGLVLIPIVWLLRGIMSLIFGRG